MFKLFDDTDKVFDSNGDKIIKPYVATVHNEDNGDYYLDIEAGLEYSDYLTKGRIIVANTPTGEQPFRIDNPETTNNRIKFRAWHVFYDTANYLIEDSYVVDMDADDALNHLNDATTPESIFTMASDIDHVDSYRCVRKSLQEAISTVIERWGGHLVRDGFNIALNESIGADHGITIEYKKNLQEIASSENWNDVVTKLLPVGTNGTLLNAVNPSASIYVTSDIQYDIPYCKTVTFEQSIKREDYSSDTAYLTAVVNDLKAQAKAYVKEHCVPEVNYTLKADLDRVVDIGDVIEVKDQRLGVDLLTNVISYDYNCLLKQYTQVEFGSVMQKLSNLVSNIGNAIDTKVKEAVNSIDVNLVESLQGSYVYWDSSRVYLLDTIPKENAVNVLKLNKDGILSSNTGISGTFRKIININGDIDPLLYAAGDTFNVTGGVVAGFSSGSNKKVTFMVNTEKSMANVSITCTQMKLTGMLGTGGYLFSSSYVSGGYDVLNDSNLDALVTKLSDHVIKVEITKSTGTFQGNDNMANSILLEAMAFTCS